MTHPAIEVSGLSKRYVIEHESRHDSLRDTLHHTARKLWRRARWGTGFEREEFYALRDISFSIQPGEVVGIIGRNGAGKSTLLKILSRITEPSTGRIAIRGRVASLLEVGTGFHPDLTGRENIFLNGAILGMSRVEIRKKFDEIVAFAEIERFLDTPVKRYSSGMYVRLAFAVAAHLEPEILIIDEVLAVGDAQFQKKCLGKMQDVARGQGRTVLFVSHNMTAMRSLTSRCIYLQNGALRLAAPTPEAIDIYTRDTSFSAGEQTGGEHATIRRAAIVDREGYELSALARGENFAVDIEVETDGHPIVSVECYLTDASGSKIGFASPRHHLGWHLPARAGLHRVRMPLRLPPMASGHYLIDVAAVTEKRGFDHYVAGAIGCEITQSTHEAGVWDLRAEYQIGHFIMEDGAPVLLPPA